MTRQQLALRIAMVACTCLMSVGTPAPWQVARFPSREIDATLTIDSDRPGRADFNFGKVVAVAGSTDGRVYVMDWLECNVKIFDRRGAYLRTFGRSGGGPGEFRCPGPQLFVHDSTLSVVDAGQARVSIFSLEGVAKRSEQLPAFPGVPSIMRTYPLGGGGRLIPTSNAGVVDAGHIDLITVRYASTNRVDTIAKIRSQMVFLSPPGRKMSVPVPSGFGQGGAWALSGDSLVAVVDGYAGTVKWFAASGTGLTLRRSESLGKSGAPVTADDLARMRQRIRADHAKSAFYQQPGLSYQNPPTQWSVATRALFSADAALWICGADQKDAPASWFVFPRSDSPFAVTLPSGFTLTSVRGDRLYGYATNELDAPIVHAYRLRPS